MDLFDLLTCEETRNYACYSELKRLLKENSFFKEKIIEGYSEGKIYGFSEEIWEKIRTQNIRRIHSFEDVFKDGANIGYCTVASKQLSYSYSNCYLCGGVLPILKGTKNCEDGSHTWLLSDGKVIDTTLMLVIDEKYSKELGYQEENRYNPNLDPIYLATKDYTLDKTISKNSK